MEPKRPKYNTNYIHIWIYTYMHIILYFTFIHIICMRVYRYGDLTSVVASSPLLATEGALSNLAEESPLLVLATRIRSGRSWWISGFLRRWKAIWHPQKVPGKFHGQIPRFPHRFILKSNERFTNIVGGFYFAFFWGLLQWIIIIMQWGKPFLPTVRTSSNIIYRREGAYDLMFDGTNPIMHH